MVLGDDAQQDPYGGPHAGRARGYGADAGGSPGPHAIALVADAHDIGLCHGLLPCRERRREGRNDQVARSSGGGHVAAR